jgi:hypothetical protein
VRGVSGSAALSRLSRPSVSAGDAAWFHLALAACSLVCFAKGRIAFLRVEGGKVELQRSPVQGQAFFYFGANVERFSETFAAVGSIIGFVPK